MLLLCASKRTDFHLLRETAIDQDGLQNWAIHQSWSDWVENAWRIKLLQQSSLLRSNGSLPRKSTAKSTGHFLYFWSFFLVQRLMKTVGQASHVHTGTPRMSRSLHQPGAEVSTHFLPFYSCVHTCKAAATCLAKTCRFFRCSHLRHGLKASGKHVKDMRHWSKTVKNVLKEYVRERWRLLSSSQVFNTRWKVWLGLIGK